MPAVTELLAPTCLQTAAAGVLGTLLYLVLRRFNPTAQSGGREQQRPHIFGHSHPNVPAVSNPYTSPSPSTLEPVGRHLFDGLLRNCSDDFDGGTKDTND